MAALQCEICGGKLVGKPGGIFECDSCGVEYSTEWCKAKVQEIRGTVRIEGPVEVQGSVKVEGRASVESLLKRGNIFLEDGDWDKADELFQQVLSIEPENAGGYLGAAMADLHLPNWDTFARRYAVAPSTLGGNKSVARARQFAAGELKSRFEELEANREQLAETYKKELAEQRAKTTRMNMIAVGANFEVVAIKADGTVLTTDSEIQETVKDWRGLVSISVSRQYIAGLRADGSVAIGILSQPDVDPSGVRALEQLDDVVQISCGSNHIVALRKNGTVMAAGSNSTGQCNVSDWTNITAISAEGALYNDDRSYTMGLRTDGTVIIAGGSELIQNGVRKWMDITAISAGAVQAVGLRADGTVVAVGDPNDGRCQVSGWRGITAVFAGFLCTIGLRSDGTLVVAKRDSLEDPMNMGIKECCHVDGWTDIVAIDAGYLHTVGLRSDGSLVATGNGNITDVRRWKLFNSWNTLDQEREIARADARRCREERRRAEEERRQRRVLLQDQMQSVQTELANLKGMFSSGKRKQLEARLLQIKEELREL